VSTRNLLVRVLYCLGVPRHIWSERVLERAGTAVHAEEHVSQPLVQITALEHVFPRCINRLLRWDGVWAIVLGVALHLLRLQPTIGTSYGDSNAPVISGGKLAYFSRKYDGLSFWMINMHFMGSPGVMCVNCITHSSSLHDRVFNSYCNMAIVFPNFWSAPALLCLYGNTNGTIHMYLLPYGAIVLLIYQWLLVHVRTLYTSRSVLGNA
jgi:hypothetical protein